MKKTWAVFATSAAMALALGLAGCGTQGASDSGDASAPAEAATSTSPAVETSPAADATPAADSSSVELSDAYVTVDWLKDNLDAVTVVDARSDTVFGANHIPGAVNLTWQATSNVVDVAQGEEGWAQIDDAATLREKALAAGIDPAKPVIVYTKVQDGWGEDGRIVWELGEAGFDDVKILDGGWTKWVGRGLEIEDGKVSNTPESPLADSGEATDADPIEQVDTAYVKDHMDSAILVDARLDGEYNSEMVMGEARMGRIPGAISIPNASLFDRDGTLLPVDQLEQILTAAGITDKSAEIITYCTGGVRGANVAEILTDLGCTNVKVYTAGFSEWAGDEDNEVENEVAVPEENAA